MDGRPKAAWIQKNVLETYRATLFHCKFWVGISRFSPCGINFSRIMNICCGLKKVVVKNIARVYFE